MTGSGTLAAKRSDAYPTGVTASTEPSRKAVGWELCDVVMTAVNRHQKKVQARGSRARRLWPRTCRPSEKERLVTPILRVHRTHATDGVPPGRHAPMPGRAMVSSRRG